ncbi:MAG: hypothetical protein ABIH23_12950 [bacterium]
MDLEKAIRTAIEYETKVRELFEDASSSTNDPVGKRIFHMLAKDEKHHVDYLTDALKEWIRTGKVTYGKLASTLPAKGTIAAAVRELETGLEDHHRSSNTLAILRKALDAEIETSEFYSKMVDELPDNRRGLFAGILEIEEAHKAFVQVQIDNIMRTGVWLDVWRFQIE